MEGVFLGDGGRRMDARALERTGRQKNFAHWLSRSSRSRSEHMFDKGHAHRIYVFSACMADRPFWTSGVGKASRASHSWRV
jgi:hypothetical protein